MMHDEGEERLSQLFVQVHLDSTSQCLSVPLKLIRHVHGVCLALLYTLLDQLGCLGEHTWLTIQTLLIQT